MKHENGIFPPTPWRTTFIKIWQNTPQLCWGDEWHPYIMPSPLGVEG